jgi:CBS domain-containing protein
MLVRDVMTAPVLSVTPATPLKEVARLLVDRRISGVPVADEAGKVLGIVSEADFLLKERGTPDRRGRRHALAWLFGDERRDVEQAKISATTAGEAMTQPAVTICADCTLREAAGLMVEKHINRLPVVDDGRLVGIVTRADLVGAFVRPDDELASIVADEVARDTMWLEPGEVTVAVVEGVVTLGGRVDRRSTAQILAKLASQVDGVVRVEADDLHWDLDDRHMEAAPERGVPETKAASLRARERPRTTG